jgi:hypothetical protein
VQSLGEGPWEIVDENDEGEVVQPKHPVCHDRVASSPLFLFIGESA